jgi:hypothetical protein
VGLTEWTNEAGARALAAVFPEFSVTPVKVSPCRVVSSPCCDSSVSSSHSQPTTDAAADGAVAAVQGGHGAGHSLRGPVIQVGAGPAMQVCSRHRTRNKMLYIILCQLLLY